MRLFLAGGVSGNLKPLWNLWAKNGDIEESMKVFLAGTYSRSWLHEEVMKMFLAGTMYGNQSKMMDALDLVPKEGEYKPYILESFYYVDAVTEKMIPHFGDFLLDSGAFTFMEAQKKGSVEVDWDDYIERYADFIVRNNVKHFFELDIDSVVGYEKVKVYRKRLEKLTGRKCIPVWHKSRGIPEWKKMCDEYDYVAIGGIVSKEITKKEYHLLPALIKEAHKRKTKVHGLGFTALTYLEKVPFDSVDSTAWTTGNRFGYVYKFDGRSMIKQDVPAGKRITKEGSRAIAVTNYNEWLKFQRWADIHL